jgi:hypothetical protein
MNYVVVFALLAGGLIHITPLIGVLGAERLAFMYGTSINDKSLELLLRHRAILFGLVGSAMLASIFIPHARLAALVAGTVSAATFIALAWSIGGYSIQLAKVVRIDLAVLPIMLAGIGILVACPPKN